MYLIFRRSLKDCSLQGPRMDGGLSDPIGAAPAESVVSGMLLEHLKEGSAGFS